MLHLVIDAGGSAGIGRATVLALASSGAIVTAAARRKERLDAVLAAAPKGSTVYAVVLDLTSEESCKAAVKEAVSCLCCASVMTVCSKPVPDTFLIVGSMWMAVLAIDTGNTFMIIQLHATHSMAVVET